MALTTPEYAFSETLVAQLRDYPEWHKGRSRYAIWMVPIDCAQVLGYMAEVIDQLADLLHPSRRQAHLTLYVCGFEQPAAVHDDDFTAARLQRQLTALAALRSAACSLEVGRPASFSSAAYLTVTDPGGHLAAWRHALAVGGTEVRFGPYVPHITLGLYRQAIGIEQLRQRLDRVVMPAGLQLPVDRLEYATYSSADMFGPLRCRQAVWLGGRSKAGRGGAEARQDGC